MPLLITLLIMAAVFGICYLADKGFTKLFRSQPQHRSGLSIRPSKRYGSMGVIVAFIGIAGVLTGITDSSTPMIIGSAVLILAGAGLAAYYLSTGIFYDEDSFLSVSLGKKQRTYRYADIIHQQLYQVQGGHLIIELHMADGSAVMVQTQMEGHRNFLNHASEQWCRAKGLDPKDRTHYDPEQYIWFPSQEDI